MATFLELCEKLAEESGGTGRAPATVLAQTGRQKKIVNWVKDAWVSIQNLNPYWEFLRAEFEGTLSIGNPTYSSTSFALPRFGDWVGGRTLTVYDTTLGRDDESYLHETDYETWKRRWDYGTHDNNRPTEFALAHDNTLRVGATPDAAYAIRGTYIKTPQILAVNADVPDMPARFHEIIVRRAIMLMAQHDEAINALNLAEREYRELLTALERDQLPVFNARASRALA